MAEIDDFEHLKARLQDIFDRSVVVKIPEVREILFIVDEGVFDCDLLLDTLKQFQERTQARMVFLPLPLTGTCAEYEEIYTQWRDLMDSLEETIGSQLIVMIFVSEQCKDEHLREEIEPVLLDDRYHFIVIFGSNDPDLPEFDISLTQIIGELLRRREIPVPVLIIRPRVCRTLFSKRVAIYVNDPASPGVVLGSIVLLAHRNPSIVLSLSDRTTKKDRHNAEILMSSLESWKTEQDVQLDITLLDGERSLLEFSEEAKTLESEMLVVQVSEEDRTDDLIGLLSEWAMILLVPTTKHE